MTDGMNREKTIWSAGPASEWAEGYPLGNGRIGAMVPGQPLHDRISLNHDRLWRQFHTFHEHRAWEILPQIRKLCRADRWDEAHDLLITRIPVSSQALYLNPFVPACDLHVRPFHADTAKTDTDATAPVVTEYRRTLSLDSGFMEMGYSVAGVKYRRQYFCSWPAGVFVIRLSAEQAGRISGEVGLSRLLDPDCEVTGCSGLGEVTLEGEFEEGVPFAVAVRVVNRGGRLTGGRREYIPPPGEIPPRDLNGLQFIFAEKDLDEQPCGVSTSFDCADEVLILVSVGTGDESTDPAGWCRDRLASIEPGFDTLMRDHVADHRLWFDRVSLQLGDLPDNMHADQPIDPPADKLIADAVESGKASPALTEKLFDFGRYLAIVSGRPAPPREPSSAPITLQGIWNQDRRPAWDCDYHLDLNLEMCYWPLPMMNLPELIDPVMDWLEGLLPEARRVAADLYGARGAHYGGVADLRHIGTTDDLCFGWIGSGAWIAQLLWHHWEYTGDERFLAERLYPLLKEIELFIEDVFIDDGAGGLSPFPSSSPEMGIAGRKRYSSLSSSSTMDLELARELLEHLIFASETLAVDESDRERWREFGDRIPRPILHSEKGLLEWLEDHEPVDPGHRHRSHFVAFCPGDRVTQETNPDYVEGIRKALITRGQSGRDRGCSLTWVWDAQMWARLYDGEQAAFELGFTAANNVMDNLLMSLLDWRESSTTLNWFDRKIFQIEASIGAVGAISELFIQDRGGLLRLLPALPTSMSKGALRGFRARGGFTIDMNWSDGAISTAKIISDRGARCRLKIFGQAEEAEISHEGRIVASTVSGETVFDTEAGGTYILSFQ